MDPLDFMESEELLQFFHCHKTEMSCYESPTVFINQLMDHNLIPEDSHKKVTRMKSKDKLKKACYDLLNWLEKNRSQHIKLFWSCVFKDTIMNQYPHLRQLRNSLMDGSFRDVTQLPERMKKEEPVDGKRREMSKDEEEEETQVSVKKKRKRLRDGEEEPSVSSSLLTPNKRKKSKKVQFYEEEQQMEPAEQQPDIMRVFNVTCGTETATLHVKRFASGHCGKSIRTETSWMTPMEFVTWASHQTDSSWRRDIMWEGNPLSVLIEEKILAIHTVNCDCSLCKPKPEDRENQKNDDECSVCKEEEGELVVCDICPRSFHQKCHLPPDVIVGDNSRWMCTFCEFRTAQKWMFWEEVEREAAMSRQISQHMKRCQYLLMFLYSADKEQHFVMNPNNYLKDYSTVIQTPMWIRKVTDKLQNNLYQTVGEFVSDIELIFTNSVVYNQNNEDFRTMSNKLKELFDSELKRVFNIREESKD